MPGPHLLQSPSLSFQPVVDLQNGQTAYVEVYVAQRELRQQAEVDGSIAALDLAVLARCLPLLAGGLRLALNVSPHTLLERGNDFLPPLLALPPAQRPLLEINDAYLLSGAECVALSRLTAGLALGLNDYQGTGLEDELLANLRPRWAKLDGDCLRKQLAGHGCHALQQAVTSCQRHGVQLAVTRIETPVQLELVRRLCGLRWGQGRLLAAERDTPHFPAVLPLPASDAAMPLTGMHAESCWHCLYSRLLEEDASPDWQGCAV